MPEIPAYCTYIWPELNTKNVNWFWLKGFKYEMVGFYYIRFTCERIAWVLRMLAFVKTAVQYSSVVFLATLLITFHIFFDLILFWVNYNKVPLAYEFEILFIYITVRGLVHPYSPEKLAKIKSLF